MKFVVIIPAYKSEERLLELVCELRTTLPDTPVVVIDDGSGSSYARLLRLPARAELREGRCAEGGPALCEPAVGLTGVW
jgi:hypothetical protein